ncbi:hypothetical protein RCO28_20655 [Streptomyces sp. LHD-70]|uniref:hypothetical protein n=1 Tax=Streptomyces sp. LHD-70 TaxID=3072140 RepID=UPI00280EDE4D|nr:hypothetical protein [Streptomyces sp. LHD-70]MDQ8704884.1 hypothetical protein [Streptomyces sp. LHD-70]
MSTTTGSVIGAIAHAAWTKFDGYNLRFRTVGGEVHAVTTGWWKDQMVPRTACPTRSYVLTEDARRTWGPVTCERPGCRELTGATGTEVAYQHEYTSLHIRLFHQDGTEERVPLDDCMNVPVRRAAVRKIHRRTGHPVLGEALRRWDSSAQQETASLDQYAQWVTEQRQRRIEEAQERGLLFDVA